MTSVSARTDAFKGTTIRSMKSCWAVDLARTVHAYSLP
jgi:hypothetical protein